MSHFYSMLELETYLKCQIRPEIKRELDVTDNVLVLLKEEGKAFADTEVGADALTELASREQGGTKRHHGGIGANGNTRIGHTGTDVEFPGKAFRQEIDDCKGIGDNFSGDPNTCIGFQTETGVEPVFDAGPDT